TFDRLQANVQSGYQFYSSNRTQLQSSEDADRELALLKIVGRAFPNIYCDLRDDLYQRVLAAQNSDNVKSGGIDSGDLELLRSSIMAHDLDHPKVQPLPTNLIEAMTPHFGAGTAKACPALNQAAPTAPVVAQATPAPTPSAPTATAPAPATSSAESTVAAAETEAAPSSAGLSAARSPSIMQGARGALRGLAVRAANRPTLGPTAATMRVFFHISAGGHRDTPDLMFANEARMGLAPFNYRVVRGVERVNPTDVPDHAQVRYFGDAERPAAEQLAAYLNWQFQDEGLQFQLVPIGAQYPNMPHENLEVWLPEPRS
ncbi:MAG TPA: hypothetical protein VG943_11490, partial [Caulobacterales bacterium]|nr:hypothetical protein [Caulobacterales bacterium]